jgi:hypothetical protein
LSDRGGMRPATRQVSKGSSAVHILKISDLREKASPTSEGPTAGCTRTVRSLLGPCYYRKQSRPQQQHQIGGSRAQLPAIGSTAPATAAENAADGGCRRPAPGCASWGPPLRRLEGCPISLRLRPAGLVPGVYAGGVVPGACARAGWLGPGASREHVSDRRPRACTDAAGFYVLGCRAGPPDDVRHLHVCQILIECLIPRR